MERSVFGVVLQLAKIQDLLEERLGGVVVALVVELLAEFCEDLDVVELKDTFGKEKHRSC